MGRKNYPVSANLGMSVILVLALAGLAVGLIPGNGAALALIALLFVGGGLYIRWSHDEADINIVLLLGLFACLAAALSATGVRLFLTTPGAALTAFWLYALIAAGYMVSRCCLGWHVGASVAVLTAFIAVGLFVQSFYGTGPAWIAALIMAAGLWWGADDWRRANGLAINE